MSTINLKCITCEKAYDPGEIRYICDCGSLLDVVHDFIQVRNNVSTDLFDKRMGSQERPYNSGVWRYKELIFPVENSKIISSPEGNTNLYESEKLAEWIGIDRIYLKHEGENPTGSFKDRGMTTGITQANVLGVNTVACASTGNTSASMAAYAALANLNAVVFIPGGKIAYGKLSQALAYGAKTFQIEGNFDDAMRLVKEASRELNLYLLNSTNPFRIEGQKSIMFEILQQLDWRVPDWVVTPGGNLGNTSAFGKAFYELKQIGFIDKLPRLAVIQAAGANPLYQSCKNGFRKFIHLDDPETIATAIKIGYPVNYGKSIRSLNWMNGIVEQVSEQEIVDAKAKVDAAGIGCEPASAASIAGVKKLFKKNVIKKDADVIAILTGHILKDPDVTIDYHLGKLKDLDFTYQNRPVNINANVDDVKRALESFADS